MEQKHVVIVLDPAHGMDVPGKCSPDMSHREYLWSRDICKRLEHELKLLGYKVFWTSEVSTEIGLTKRKENANIINISSKEVKFLLSLHNNAAGNGKNWCNARGIEIWTSVGKTLSDYFADYLFEGLKAYFPENLHKYRYNMPKSLERDKEKNFTVLMGDYAACLVEWLFQDNPEDLKLLQDEDTNNLLVKALVKGIELINQDVKSKIR